MPRNATASADSDTYRPELSKTSRAICAAKSLWKFAARNWREELVVLSPRCLLGFDCNRFDCGCVFLPDALRSSLRKCFCLKTDQIELTGNHIVGRESVVNVLSGPRPQRSPCAPG